MFDLRAIIANHSTATKGGYGGSGFLPFTSLLSNKATTEFSYGYRYSKKKQIA